MLAKHIVGDFSRFFEGASTFLTPKLPFAALKTIRGSKKFWPPQKPIENTNYALSPHKKITSYTIRNSGALIVKTVGASCIAAV
jgi:hypothetical protein